MTSATHLPGYSVKEYPRCSQCGYIYPDCWSPCPKCNAEQETHYRDKHTTDERDRILALLAEAEDAVELGDYERAKTNIDTAYVWVEDLERTK